MDQNAIMGGLLQDIVILSILSSLTKFKRLWKKS